jgi:hypothetical protein
MDYLDIPYEEEAVRGYRSVDFRGSMGDQTGDTKYDGVESASVHRWRTVLTSITRRRFARWWLRRLGVETLQTFGVSLSDLEKELEAMPFNVSGAFRDLLWLVASSVSRNTLLSAGHYQRRLPPDHRHKLD